VVAAFGMAAAAPIGTAGAPAPAAGEEEPPGAGTEDALADEAGDAIDAFGSASLPWDEPGAAVAALVGLAVVVVAPLGAAGAPAVGEELPGAGVEDAPAEGAGGAAAALGSASLPCAGAPPEAVAEPVPVGVAGVLAGVAASVRVTACGDCEQLAATMITARPAPARPAVIRSRLLPVETAAATTPAVALARALAAAGGLAIVPAGVEAWWKGMP
jgi:hypothetical protein